MLLGKNKLWGPEKSQCYTTLVALSKIRFRSLFFDVEKRRQCSEVTSIFLLTEQNLNMPSEMKILFKNLYAKEILVSIAFHSVDPTFATKQQFQTN